MRSSVLVVAVFAHGLVVSQAIGEAPGSVEVTCDVDRTAFRLAASNQTQVTFRLWDADTGGSQCGPDYVLPMADLVVLRVKTDRFDGEKTRRFAALRAVLGSDSTPVQLCSGSETWLDVSVGLQTLTCDFSAKVPSPRKRLHAAPFAGVSGGEGGVTQIDTGAGLQGGPITATGAIAVNAPTCAGSDKLTWTGSAFQCSADQTGMGGSGTVMSVGSGAGLAGGPITTSGSLSVSAPTCGSNEVLTWSGAAFQCASIPPSSDVNCMGCVCGSDIGDGCITGADVADGTITGDDIQDGTVSTSDLIGNAFSNGVTSRVGSAASGLQNIPHGLGAVPRRVDIRAFKNVGSSSTAYSIGTYDSSGTSCIFQTSVNSSTGLAGSDAANILFIKDANASNTQEATVSVDASNIVLSWTKNATPTADTIYISWAAQR